MLDNIHQRAGGKQGDAEQIQRGTKGAAFRTHGGDEVFQRRRVMRNLQQPDKAQHAKPAQVDFTKYQRQQAWQNGDEIDQAGEAEDIFQPPRRCRLVLAGLVRGDAPDPEKIFAAEYRDREHFKGKEKPSVARAQRIDRFKRYRKQVEKDHGRQKSVANPASTIGAAGPAQDRQHTLLGNHGHCYASRWRATGAYHSHANAALKRVCALPGV